MTMYVALNENNNLVQIENVERGLACKCTCFECGETVIARKGDIKEHHFAHASNKESCNQRSHFRIYGFNASCDPKY